MKCRRLTEAEVVAARADMARMQERHEEEWRVEAAAVVFWAAVAASKRRGWRR